MKENKILVTGANGQIGKVLTKALRERYGQQNVIASDITKPDKNNQPYVFLDILNEIRLKEIIEDYQITQIYHLAAILSANGEWKPLKTWNINLNGLLTILELGREKHIDKIFFPSTIAVFGKTTPRINTPQDVAQLPTTVYGMSKTSGELWCNYYHTRYGVDVRCIRYPGIIGYQSIPSGGTTDYAVEIFHKALEEKSYTSFLDKETKLPMMYMQDAIRATIELMEAPGEKLSVRYGYNITAMSFSPEEIAVEIRKHIPDFKMSYQPDFRQQIAESWTESIDDSMARKEWGWNHEFDLSDMVEDMLYQLRNK